MRGRRPVVLALGGLLAASLGVAADLPCGSHDGDRPSVGLVLSGGGALGAAHIGVLEVLEEMHVPVDCVAGTSMGAIVGGLYANGMTPGELVDLVATLDWRDLLIDRPDRRRMPYRRKLDDLTYLAPIEVGFNHGKFQLPPALVVGHELGFLIQRLTIESIGHETFDDLPIPFRAVATDIESGEPVVLDHGDLGRAIRASMAVPGVFSPMLLDGHLLVDGGLVMNLPVELARNMGADVILAVEVDTQLRSREELRSLSSQISQMLTVLLDRNMRQQAEDADVLVRVTLEGFGSAAFERSPEMIPLGKAAARELAPVLRTLALDDDAWAAHLAWRHRSPPEVPDRIGAVQLTIGSTADPEEVLRRVRVRPGDPFDLEALARDVEGLFDLGLYERVDFFITPDDDGAVVHLEAQDRSWGPNVMRFGLNLFADLRGESFFNLRANYTMTDLGPFAAEAKVAVQLGEETGAVGELYQSLGLWSPWFVAGYLEDQDFRVGALLEPGLYGEYTVGLGDAGIDLGYALGRWGELRLGINRGRGEARPRQGPDGLPTIDFDWGGWRARAVIDQLDNPNFPQDGFIVAGEYFRARSNIGSDSDYEKLALSATGASTWGRQTFLSTVEVGTALGTDLPFWNEFQLGGLFRLSGFEPRSLSGPYLGLGVLTWYTRIGNLNTAIGDGVYAGLSAELGNVWESSGGVSVSSAKWAGSAFVGVDTILGPLYFALGNAAGGERAWYLFIGRSF
jgi:NTE family protein